jgi:triacylglycerol lipase
MEINQLIMFANISAITYDNPKDSKAKFKSFGFNIVDFFDIEGAQAYLLKDMNGIHVLSFRGTEVTEKSDVLADLKAGKNIEACGGKVHVGFKGEINKVWPTIEKAIANIDMLYVTGHSLGAAMATIAASRMQSKVTALITFGSPRVGNQEFVNSLNVTHYRVQNNCDDVTKVPFRLVGFRHHGTHKYMNFYGEFRDLTAWQRVKDMIRSRLKARAKGQKYIGVFDHLMANYIAKLEKSKGN